MRVIYRAILIVSFSFVSFSCNDGVDAESVPNDQNTVFVRSLVSSENECNQLLAQGINCTKWIELLNDSIAQVIVTDIGNEGKYEIENNQLRVNFSIPVEIESPLIFEINDDFTVLTRISDKSNELWKKQVEDVKPWDL